MAKKKKKDDTQDKLVNLQAATLAAQVANWAAQLEFSKERFRLLEMPQFQQGQQLEVDKLAFQKAQAAWENAFKESSLTGTYNGVPTIEWLTEQARMTGVLNGQETLEGKLTNAQIKQMDMEMNLRNQQHLLEVGKFDWAKELEGKQLQLQTELQEANLTGLYKGKATFEREQFEADQGQKYLSLVASLRGAGNAFRQFNTLQAGQRMGLQSMGDQWAGRYGSMAAPPAANPMASAGLGTGNATGLTPEQAAMGTGVLPNQGAGAGLVGGAGGIQLTPEQQEAARRVGATPEQYAVLKEFFGGPQQTQQQPVASQMQAPAGELQQPVAGSDPRQAPSGYDPAYTVSDKGQQAPLDAYNYQNTPSGQPQIYPPGVASPVGDQQVSTNSPVTLSKATEMYGAAFDPRQIDARKYSQQNPYAQQMAWAAFEDMGWDPEAAQAQFQMSLPKYGGPAAIKTAGGFS